MHLLLSLRRRKNVLHAFTFQVFNFIIQYYFWFYPSPRHHVSPYTQNHRDVYTVKWTAAQQVHRDVGTPQVRKGCQSLSLAPHSAVLSIVNTTHTLWLAPVGWFCQFCPRSKKSNYLSKFLVDYFDHQSSKLTNQNKLFYDTYMRFF